jgi:glycerophosphoryl diester phosphodiesterase
MQIERPADGPALIVGHRGARGLAPENTIASFETARQIGVDWVELDVHVSKDDQLVVMHDATVDRTTDGHGYLRDMTLSEIRGLDAGSWFDSRFAGQKVPTLPEVLEWGKGEPGLVIELKGGFQQALVPKVVDLIWNHDRVSQVILISFNHRAIQHVKALRPEIRTGILYVARLVNSVAVARDVGADALHPNYNYVDPDLVHEAHTAGLAVSTWTVNEPEIMGKLVEMGVDSIATDYPDRLVAVVEDPQRAEHRQS